MPFWVYTAPLWFLAVAMVLIFEILSLGGLLLTRRYLAARLHFHDGVNDAVGGTIQAIGVFYGITVGLIAVSVWNGYDDASSLASAEAATIGILYRDVSAYPEPARTELRDGLRNYTTAVIERDWPVQERGQVPDESANALTALQMRLTNFEPATAGQQALHAEALRTFNQLVQDRRLRIDGATNALSGVMWLVIWIGAAISISVGYFFHIEDARLHGVLIGLMSGFLAIAVFLIVANDRPFVGEHSVTPDSYRLVIETLMRAP